MDAGRRLPRARGRAEAGGGGDRRTGTTRRNQRLLCLPAAIFRTAAVRSRLRSSRTWARRSGRRSWISTTGAPPVWVDPRLPGQHEAHAVGRGDVSGSRDLRGGAPVPAVLFEQLGSRTARPLCRRSSRVVRRDHRRGRQPAAWAAAFLDKVRQVREAGPCPAFADKGEGRREKGELNAFLLLPSAFSLDTRGR